MPARADVGSVGEETVSKTKSRTWWCWMCCCRTSSPWCFPGIPAALPISHLLFLSSSYRFIIVIYQKTLWHVQWGRSYPSVRVRMRSMFSPREEERSSDYLWLDADHLLSWLWRLGKGEAFSPRFLQSLESSGFLRMSVESEMFPVLGSAGTGHAVPLTGLCALALCIYCRVLLQGQPTKGLTLHFMGSQSSRARMLG